MLRDDWTFEYTGNKLAVAAGAKLKYHRDRFDWWLAKKKEVMDKIRAEGLEIDESIALQGGVSPKARDWQGGAQVMIRNDLQNDLAECLRKLHHHTAMHVEYEGWVQVLEANPDARMCLNHDDWLFFFGKDQ